MKRPLLFCMILVLALGAIGTAYAGWSDAVLIRADAASGELTVGLRCLSVDSWCCCRCCREKECHRQEPGVSWSNGWFVFDLGGYPYYESIDLSFTNPCSCFSPLCSLEIANGGTIPARLKNLCLDWWGDDAVAFHEWTVVFLDDCQESGSGAAGLRSALRGTVLDPGEKILVELGFRLKRAGDLAGCSIRVDFLRWNQNF